MTRYRAIVADPPWEYEEGFPQGPGAGARRKTVPLPYEGMPLHEIQALPVGEMADTHAWLFLWTTNKYLPFSFPLMRAWGFAYRQTITWRKTVNPSPFVTCLAPSHSEFLLIGRRGQPGRKGAFPSSVVEAPSQTRHSAKPDLFLDLVEGAVDGPYVELFARRARFGWDYWGDQSLGTAEVPWGNSAPKVRYGQ